MPVAVVVADGEWVTNEVRASLTSGDWVIEQLSDSRSIARRLEESRVDAVVVDMQVGSKGGMAIIRTIRHATDPLNRPRTVLLLDRSADRFIARRAGADASVLKPINAAELRAALSPTAVTAPSEEE